MYKAQWVSHKLIHHTTWLSSHVRSLLQLKSTYSEERKEALPAEAAAAAEAQERERESLHPDWNVKAEMDVKDAHSSSLIE